MKQGMKDSLTGFLRTILMASCVGLCGCSDSLGPEHVAGIEGTGTPLSTGTIDRFGSIYVNGIHFNIDGARVTIDGEQTQPEELDLGMVVTVQGPIDTDLVRGTAQSVTVENTVQGAVSDITDIGGGQRMIVVLGQAVLAVPDTFVDDLELETLEVGQRVLISGYRDSERTVVATRLAAASGEGVKLVDKLSGLDLDNSRFILGTQTVDFSQAVISGGRVDDLRSGLRVAVEGELTSEQLLRAERVRILKSPTAGASTGTVSLQAIVTQWQSKTHFALAEQRVDASQAEFTGGEQDSLVVGDRVAVVGRIDDQGLLQARTVHLFRPTAIQLEGPVEAIDAASNTLTVLGTKFSITAFTGYHDHSRVQDRFLSLEHLSLGDRVEVLAREEFGKLIAIQLRRKDAPALDMMNIVLQGRVSRLDGATQFFVSEVAVDASELNDPRALDLLEHLEAGQEVRVEGVQTGTNSIRAVHLDIRDLPQCLPHQSPPGCTLHPHPEETGPLKEPRRESSEVDPLAAQRFR